MASQGVLLGTGSTPSHGTHETLFAPDALVDRAAAVTVLHRLAGSPQAAYGGEFSDVAPSDYFAPGVAWAVRTGVLSGFPDGTFRPHDLLDRAQLTTLFYHYAQAWGAPTACSGDLSAYLDAAAVPDYAVTPFSWAVSNSILAPLLGVELHPTYHVTRSQLAQVLVALDSHCTYRPEAYRIALDQLQAVKSRSRAAHGTLQADVNAAAKKYGAMGVQVAVIEKGQVTDTFTYGCASEVQYTIYDTETGKTITIDGSMTPNHKLRTASLTKVVVGMTAMALAERGVVDLDASIGAYWGCSARNPYYPDAPVSIRSLLTHTSSIPIYGDDVSRSRSAVQSRLSSGSFSHLKPGSLNSWGYNNYAFGVLGMTLELADGRILDDVAGEYLFDPLAMDAAFESGGVKYTDLLASTYAGRTLTRSARQAAKYGPPSTTPGASGTYFAGGFTTSAPDLAKLVAVLAEDGVYEGQQILSADSVTTMETSIGIPYGQSFQQCQPLRLQKNIYGRDRLYYHTGSSNGLYHLLSYDPDTGDGVVVLTTGASGSKDSYGIYAVCGQITQAVYAATQA